MNVQFHITAGQQVNCSPGSKPEVTKLSSPPEASTEANRFSDHFITPAQTDLANSALPAVPTQTWERFDDMAEGTTLNGLRSASSVPPSDHGPDGPRNDQRGSALLPRDRDAALGGRKLSEPPPSVPASGTEAAAVNNNNNNNPNTAQWTALDGQDQHSSADDVDSEGGGQDQSNLPFRKTQSMRATANRKIKIVDALRQRRLSNSSLDRETRHQPQFNDDEDDLSRKHKIGREWRAFLRVPKRTSGATVNWVPVTVSVKDGVLSIKPDQHHRGEAGGHSAGTVPSQDIRLFHNHTITIPAAKHYDRKTKLHQIKLQRTYVQERRSLKRLFFLEHVSLSRTILKLGCPDISVVTNISDAINEAVRLLPVTREHGVAYRVNEVFIEVRDCSEILMNCDGAVLERLSLNRIYVQAFLTGSIECSLQLNNIEALLLQGRSHTSGTMSRQLKLNDVVLHPCVDKNTYKATREIKFQPLDGVSFELLRCSIDPYVSPPLTVNALIDYDELRNSVRMTASFSVRKKLDLLLKPITELTFKFPVPPAWTNLFILDTTFGRKAVRSTSALRGSFRRKVKTTSCQITAHMGSAKYEPEHGAIMWRIGSYSRTSLPHTFSCDIHLEPGMPTAEVGSYMAEVSYSIPGNSTGLQVCSFQATTSTPEKWVKYEIQYHYKVQMFPDLSVD